MICICSHLRHSSDRKSDRRSRKTSTPEQVRREIRNVAVKLVSQLTGKKTLDPIEERLDIEILRSSSELHKLLGLVNT